MYLQALATANPDRAFTQSACWEIAQRPHIRSRLDRRSMFILRKVLCGESGIDTRHLAIADFERVFDRSPDDLNNDFRREAPALAGSALEKALGHAGIRARDLDALFICTCTGYLCPGVSSYVSEQSGIRREAYLQDLVGHGCGAAIPMLRSAAGFTAANPDATVACIAVEICSAAFYIDDDYGVLVSACLFADGAAATIWGPDRSRTGLRPCEFETIHVPENRDLLRFEMRDGKLRNLLDRSVPERAAEAVSTLWARRGDRPVSAVAVHPGGRDVIAALEPVLSPHDLEASVRILRRFGNMSSPSVLYALGELLRREDPPSGDIWMTSFGAGFSAHACRLQRD